MTREEIESKAKDLAKEHWDCAGYSEMQSYMEGFKVALDIVWPMVEERMTLIGNLGHAIPTLKEGQEYPESKYKNVLAEFIMKERAALKADAEKLAEALSAAAYDRYGYCVNHAAKDALNDYRAKYPKEE